MYINNNLTSQRCWEQSLLQEIRNLNHKLQNWKVLLRQLPGSESLPRHHLALQINQKLDNIYQILQNFIRNFMRQQQYLKDQVERHQYRQKTPSFVRSQSFEELVSNKLEFLEQNLRKTKKSQQQLVQKLNYVMARYQSLEHQNKILNSDSFDPESLGCRERTTPFLMGLKSCGTENQPNSLSFTKEKVYPTVNQELVEKKYLHFKEAGYSLDYSTESRTNQSNNQDHFRIFSQPERKVSLRHYSNKVQDYLENKPDRIGLSRERDKRMSKHASLNKHEHRLQFMMNKLGQ